MNIFISANNTEKGKTHSTLLLMEEFAKKGFRVGAMKPVETGVEDVPADGIKLLTKLRKLNREFENIQIEDIVPVMHRLPASPYVSGEVDFEKIKKSYEKIKPLCDILLIEGAGGLLVPVNEKFLMVDFLEFFNARLFMVFGSNLGMINDFLLNRYYLQKEGIDYVWAVNLFDEEGYFRVSHPYMKRFSPLFIQKDLDTITQKLLGV